MKKMDQDWIGRREMRLRMPHLSFLMKLLSYSIRKQKNKVKLYPDNEKFSERLHFLNKVAILLAALQKELDNREKKWKDADTLLEVFAGVGNSDQDTSNIEGAVSKPVRKQVFRVKELMAWKYRRYAGVGKWIRLKTAMPDGEAGSLFLIGANGAGKSSLYNGLEYMLTGSVQEGGLRSQDFRPKAELGEKIRIHLDCNGTSQEFDSPEDIMKKYPDVDQYGVFVSEVDILRLGQLESEQDYTYFFAQLMGYGDLLCCLDAVRWYIDKNESLTSLDRFEKDLEEARKDWLESQKKRIVQENRLLGEEVDDKSALLLKGPLVGIRRISQKLAGWCRQNEKERNLEDMIVALETIDRYVRRYSRWTADQSLIGQYQNLKEVWGIWLQNQSKSADDLTLGMENGNRKDQWEYVCQAIEGFDAFLTASTVSLEQEIRKYAQLLNEEDKKKKAFEDLSAQKDKLTGLQQLKSLSEELDGIIRRLVKKNYKKYATWIMDVMNHYHNEKGGYLLKIAYEGDRPDSMLKMFLVNKDKNKEVLPAQYYNNFRYKLFCLLLRLVGGLAYMKLNKMRVPIVLDDVFYGSDFNSRAEVKYFWQHLMRIIKQQLGEEVQLLVFTHDEIILNAALDAVVEVGFAPVQFGRILDHDCMWNPEISEGGENENNVFVKFFEYTKKEVRGDA